MHGMRQGFRELSSQVSQKMWQTAMGTNGHRDPSAPALDLAALLSLHLSMQLYFRLQRNQL